MNLHLFLKKDHRATVHPCPPILKQIFTTLLTYGTLTRVLATNLTYENTSLKKIGFRQLALMETGNSNPPPWGNFFQGGGVGTAKLWLHLWKQICMGSWPVNLMNCFQGKWK